MIPKRKHSGLMQDSGSRRKPEVGLLESRTSRIAVDYS